LPRDLRTRREEGSVNAPRHCELPALDPEVRACDAPPVPMRTGEGVTFDAGDAGAADVDAPQSARVVTSTGRALDLASLIRGAGAHAGRVRGRVGKRRVVVRFDPGEIERLNALRAQFPKASRAAIVRAFCLFGASMVEGHDEATTAPTEGSTL